MMIIFKSNELQGYGFDLGADRVVRFTKHPDGVYLNTRATYKINKQQYTHAELRLRATQENSPTIIDLNRPVTYRHWLLLGVIVAVILLFCTVEVNIETSVTQPTETKGAI